MKILKYLLFSILPLALLGIACSDDDNGLTGVTGPGTDGSTSTTRIYLTDAPATFDSVLITFNQVSINADTGWVTVSSETQTHDLLTLTGSATVLLGEAELEPGSYGQIRLIITEAAVVIDGQRHTLTVPSGARTGLKIGNGFTVRRGEELNLVLDFDAARSVVTAGASGMYLLKPTIRLTHQEESGGIEGRIVVPADSSVEGWTVYAMTGGDTVSSSLVEFDEGGDQLGGEFEIGFLPDGSYDVVLADSAGNEVHSFGTVTVTAGSDTELGTVFLLGATSGELAAVSPKPRMEHRIAVHRPMHPALVSG